MRTLADFDPFHSMNVDLLEAQQGPHSMNVDLLPQKAQQGPHSMNVDLLDLFGDVSSHEERPQKPQPPQPQKAQIVDLLSPSTPSTTEPSTSCFPPLSTSTSAEEEDPFDSFFCAGCGEMRDGPCRCAPTRAALAAPAVVEGTVDLLSAASRQSSSGIPSIRAPAVLEGTFDLLSSGSSTRAVPEGTVDLLSAEPSTRAVPEGTVDLLFAGPSPPAVAQNAVDLLSSGLSTLNMRAPHLSSPSSVPTTAPPTPAPRGLAEGINFTSCDTTLPPSAWGDADGTYGSSALPHGGSSCSLQSYWAADGAYGDALPLHTGIPSLRAAVAPSAHPERGVGLLSAERSSMRALPDLISDEQPSKEPSQQRGILLAPSPIEDTIPTAAQAGVAPAQALRAEPSAQALPAFAPALRAEPATLQATTRLRVESSPPQAHPAGRVLRVGSFNMSFAADLGLAIGTEQQFIGNAGRLLQRFLQEGGERKTLAQANHALWENSVRMVADFFSHSVQQNTPQENAPRPAVLGLQELNERARVNNVNGQENVLVQGVDRIEAEMKKISKTLRVSKCQVHSKQPNGQVVYPTMATVFDATLVGESVHEYCADFLSLLVHPAGAPALTELPANLESGRPISIVLTSFNYLLVNMHLPRKGTHTSSNRSLPWTNAELIGDHVGRMQEQILERTKTTKTIPANWKNPTVFVTGDFNDRHPTKNLAQTRAKLEKVSFFGQKLHAQTWSTDMPATTSPEGFHPLGTADYATGDYVFSTLSYSRSAGTTGAPRTYREMREGDFDWYVKSPNGWVKDALGRTKPGPGDLQVGKQCPTQLGTQYRRVSMESDHEMVAADFFMEVAV